MADDAAFVAFSKGKLETDLVLAMKLISGISYSLGILVDKDGNDIDFDATRDLNGGLKVSLWDGYPGLDLQSVAVNNPYVVRKHNDRESWFSATPVLPAAAFQMAWDRTRAHQDGTGAFRKVSLPTRQWRLAANVAATFATAVENAPAQGFAFTAENTTATAVYAKIYNKATAAVAGDTPAIVINIPANTAIDRDLCGFSFNTGISVAFTTTYDGTTVPANGAVIEASLLVG